MAVKWSKKQQERIRQNKKPVRWVGSDRKKGVLYIINKYEIWNFICRYATCRRHICLTGYQSMEINFFSSTSFLVSSFGNVIFRIPFSYFAWISSCLILGPT